MVQARQTSVAQLGWKPINGRRSATAVLSALFLLGGATAGSVLYFFDPNSYGFYPTCLFHQSTGLMCPGCGSLRALHHLLHGQVWMAFQYNPMLVSALPVAAVIGAMIFTCGWRGKPMTFQVPRKWLWLIVGLGLAFSIWRNIPGCPFLIRN